MAADAPNSSSEDGLLDGVLHQQYTNTLESIADAVRHCAALVEAEGRTGSTTRDEMRKNLRALLESVEAQQAAAPTVEDLAAQEKASAAAEVTRYWSKASGGGGGAAAGAESSTTRSTKADILSLRDRLTSSQKASKGAMVCNDNNCARAVLLSNAAPSAHRPSPVANASSLKHAAAALANVAS